MEHLDYALKAMKDYKPRTSIELEDVKSKAGDSLEGICTGCAYCRNCPQGIPIPEYMDAYNQKLLNKSSNDPIGERLYWHWDLERADAGKCTACGICEETCTQHLDIINRLKEIAESVK
jgi:predicted aldo/keto reductase-like oxidoreductase